MDGKRFHKLENDRPITKPSFPLPMAFNPSKRSELATRPQSKPNGAAPQRAHFYRKQTTESGAPVYGFYITEGQDNDLYNH
jgi:hypothetical protein